MKGWNLTINTENNIAKLTVNSVVEELELYTSDKEHYCLALHLNFPSEAVKTLPLKPFQTQKN